MVSAASEPELGAIERSAIDRAAIERWENEGGSALALEELANARTSDPPRVQPQDDDAYRIRRKSRSPTNRGI